jgi:myo-inositol-1(or 4)-monophosphatase
MDTDMMQSRLAAAKDIAREAGALGAKYFQDISTLDIKSKGTQDLVSNADLEVELLVRDRILAAFPDDGIVGEEHAPVATTSGWTWVIDPIDGTANFVRGIPQWCVILAVVFDDKTRIGVIFEPSTGEMFWTGEGMGAFVGDRKMAVAKSEGLDDGSVGVGMNGRTPTLMVVSLVTALAERGGIFFRNASGGLMLAYVAAGRLIGYTEPHMNAWDCLAGQLLIAESGGRVEDQSADDLLANGGRVIAGSPDIYDELLAISEAAFKT